MPVARHHLCRDLRREAQPLAGQPLDLGVSTPYVPTAPASLPTRMPSSAAESRPRSRSSSNAQPASLAPKVMGSAWTPCVRPAMTVSRCSSARRITAAWARSTPSRTKAPAPDLKRRRGVQHIRRREPVVEPAASGPEALGHGVDEGGKVVLRPLLDLGDPLWRRRHSERPRLGGGLCRHGSNLRPRAQRGQLDLEPARQLATPPTRCSS